MNANDITNDITSRRYDAVTARVVARNLRMDGFNCRIVPSRDRTHFRIVIDGPADHIDGHKRS
jgi:hypothetical protein